METSITPIESSKQKTVPTSNIDPELAELIAGAGAEDLMKLRALADFFAEKNSKPVGSMEIIYQSLTERLDVVPMPFGMFCRHYLYSKMVRNLEEIRPFVEKLGVTDATQQQYRFWRLAAHLLENSLKHDRKEVNLITMVSFLYKIPELFNKAYPALNAPIVKARILNQGA